MLTLNGVAMALAIGYVTLFFVAQSNKGTYAGRYTAVAALLLIVLRVLTLVWLPMPLALRIVDVVITSAVFAVLLIEHSQPIKEECDDLS